MVSDINTILSHPNKSLIEHITGVRNKIRLLTDSRIAELVAVFHDLGKVNPNFQSKLKNKIINNGYSNHAYLSAYLFFCTLFNNPDTIKKFLGTDRFNLNDIPALTILIAKHHGNLSDFSPEDYSGSGTTILSKKEIYNLFQFLDKEANIPFEDIIDYFFDFDNAKIDIRDKKIQTWFSNNLLFKEKFNTKALEFFLDYQFAFSCLIQADKADAGNLDNFIEKQMQDISDFSAAFISLLPLYLNNLKQNTELNKLRTKIREEAVSNIFTCLKAKECIFELTAPTGSGKTLMMLSLASEIIKEKGAKRIIYALPFLSITEQVEAEILKIFTGCENHIQRIDSKSENKRFEELQTELDSNPAEEKQSEINILEFQENTFAYPLVITTFVRFFETLLSNRNAELLKLPNFSNCIFLLDEIQSLPPRLYGFFIAYLRKFCEKFGSYAIISTATQPNFELPSNNDEARKFFSDYQKPTPLLPLHYFNHDLFNRYSITRVIEDIDVESLKERILQENKSVLVILNTIDDTKDLFRLLQNEVENEELLLLNTHFTPQHRKLKIYLAKRRLREKKRTVLISTQLIEAGVDIDFPVLYRDFAIVSSIVQSAGRCNRNGKLDSSGKVILFNLHKNRKSRAKLIYQGKDKDILTFTQQALLSDTYEEKELIEVQQNFFNRIQSELLFARHSQNSPKLEFDFLKDITKCKYEKIGHFQLIDKEIYGKEKQYFIPKNDKDKLFDKLLELHNQLIDLFKVKSDFVAIKRKKKEIEIHIKRMSNQIIQIRLKKNQTYPLLGCSKSYFNLSLIDSNCYSFVTGVDLEGSEFIL